MGSTQARSVVWTRRKPEMAARTAASRRGEREIPRRRTEDIDLCVGARMRERRLMLGLTQHEMAS